MAAIPSTPNTKLNNMLRQIPFTFNNRGYLGMSQLGHPCKRYLWLTLYDLFRGQYSYRTKRIFDRGDLEEARVIKDLEFIGCKVTQTQCELELLGGLIKGHIDGIVSNVPSYFDKVFLLEIKTMRDTSWKTFYKKGVEKANEQYYGQVQIYMGEMSLEQALFVGVNKNTEELYFEIIEYDDVAHQKLLDKAIDIVATETIPSKIGSADWFQCKMCSMYDFCHGFSPVHRCCRSCKHGTLENNNVACTLKHEEEDQRLGCKTDWESRV